MVSPHELLETLESLGLPAVALRTGSAEVTELNASAKRLLGLGEDASRWLERIHPSDRDVVTQACRSGATHAAFRATSDDLVFRKLQIELRPRDGITLGVLTALVSVASSAEAELEALLEALPFDVWERDEEQILIRQNATSLRRWGAKLGGSVAAMGMPEETVAIWRELNERGLHGEVVSRPIDYEVAGKRVNYINLIAPVRDGERICGIVGVNIDITATKEAEAERDASLAQERRARATAEAAERRSAELVLQLSRSLEELAHAQSKLVRRERLAALGELAAVVAHEVRNPLAAIYTSLSTLKRHLTFDKDTAVLFQILEEEASRLNRTVGDLLNYVRPLEPERRPDDLVELANEVVKQRLQAKVPSSPIETEVLSPTRIEPISADPVLMRIALSNLVTNAMQAMPEGGKLTVTVSEAREGQRSAVAIAVRDTGKGIPSDVLPRVFEPFFTTRASGAGLGLAVVRRIVEAHDGQVTAESDEKLGTVFTVVLPR